jgi:hypothetical protein
MVDSFVFLLGLLYVVLGSKFLNLKPRGLYARIIKVRPENNFEKLLGYALLVSGVILLIISFIA